MSDVWNVYIYQTLSTINIHILTPDCVENCRQEGPFEIKSQQVLTVTYMGNMDDS